jgi:WD40 repeat protein
LPPSNTTSAARAAAFAWLTAACCLALPLLPRCASASASAGSKPLFRLAAHNKAACVLSFCSAAPGLLATASTDKVVKLWDVSDGKPSMLTSMEPKLGAVFSGGFCADVPYLLAMAGAKGSVGVWDVRSSAAVAAKWPALMADVVAQPPPGS